MVSGRRVIAALRTDGFYVADQEGSHIKMRKLLAGRVLTVIVPAHRELARDTLSSILKPAHLTPADFMSLL